MDDQRFMTLKNLQNIFYSHLEPLYGKNEVQSFFRVLTEHYLQIKYIDIALHPEQLVSNHDLNKFNKAIERLKLEEPIQYIIGETEFFGLPLKVDSSTLIPRPETEDMVRWILDQELVTYNKQLSILDIGTGSGCIAIALAKHLSNSKVYAMDISPKALKVAQENALLNKVEVKFFEGDILNSNPEAFPVLPKKFDVIVSNPPYVRGLEKAMIKNNVLKYEPLLALFVEDEDPLLFYKAICKFTVHNLKVGGMLFFEINQYLGEEMKQLMYTFNFKSVELKKDLFGNDRMIKSIQP